MSNCDLCGRETELFRVEVEGSFVNACERCGRFGKIIGRANKNKIELKKKNLVDEKIEVIVEDYDRIIRRERERRGLRHEDLAKKLNEKESVIQKIENKQMMPGLELARKMEKFFGIKLVEDISDDKIEIKHAESRRVTLGDVIKQKGAG